MIRYAKKNLYDGMGGAKTHRSQRKQRGKLSGVIRDNKRERRYGWAYSKRRAFMEEM